MHKYWCAILYPPITKKKNPEFFAYMRHIDTNNWEIWSFQMVVYYFVHFWKANSAMKMWISGWNVRNSRKWKKVKKRQHNERMLFTMNISPSNPQKRYKFLKYFSSILRGNMLEEDGKVVMRILYFVVICRGKECIGEDGT